MKMKPIGIYIHVPFCKRKCAYCDFFSVCTLKTAEDYTLAVLKDMEKFRAKGIFADTLYLGGGTPTELPADSLCRIIQKAREIFGIDPSAEITVETNPSENQQQLLEKLAVAGVNRLSVGMQSSDSRELEFLGRAHRAEQIQSTVEGARKAGIKNISLDLMLGIPFQTEKSLETSVEFASGLGVDHISAYILKVEEKTVFNRLLKRGELPLCDDETCARLYLSAAELLQKHGFFQYEISNFAKKGFESRHNLKYWQDEPYLGFGPSAHSFFEGRRFFYPPSIRDYIKNQPPVEDGKGGSFEEFLMLGLRLCKGIRFEDVKKKFGFSVPTSTLKTAKELAEHGLMTVDGEKMALTRQGFLLSNEIISRLI